MQRCSVFEDGHELKTFNHWMAYIDMFSISTAAYHLVCNTDPKHVTIMRAFTLILTYRDNAKKRVVELHSNELLTFGPVFSFFQLRKQQRHSWGLVAATLEKLEVSLSLTAVVFFQTAAVEERIREREKREKKSLRLSFKQHIGFVIRFTTWPTIGCVVIVSAISQSRG